MALPVTSGKENEMSLRGPKVKGRLADKQHERWRFELLGIIRPGCHQGLSQMAHNAIRAAPCALPPRPNDRVTLSCIFGFSAPPVPIVYNDLNLQGLFLRK